jgi:hypothetical protein
MIDEWDLMNEMIMVDEWDLVNEMIMVDEDVRKFI